MNVKNIFLALFSLCFFGVTNLPAQTPAHVIITAGQSNTDGRVNNKLLPPYIKAQATDTVDFKTGAYRFCKISQNRHDGIFVPYFPQGRISDGFWTYDAVTYYLLEQALQEDFYIVKYAVGGTSIQYPNDTVKGRFWSANPEWLKKTASFEKKGNSLLLSFTEGIDAAIDSTLSKIANGYRIDAFLWHQGESDQRYADRYYGNLKAVIAYVRSHLTQKTGEDYSCLPFVFGSIPKSNRFYSDKVDDAMRRIAEEDPNAYLIDMSEQKLQGDRTHFNSESAEYLGVEMYKVLDKILNLNKAGFRVARYRGDKTAAISYTFDDGLKEHYTLVAPQFKDLGFKGTFWINGKNINRDEKNIADSTRVTWENLKKMAQQGHEISNHGWAHRNFSRFSFEEIKEDITKNDSAIFANTGIMPRTYCYPNNNKSNPEAVAFVKQNRVGTRTEQFSIGGKATHENLEKRVSDLLKNKDWGVGMTHGITYGYDHFSDANIFWEHLKKVKAQEDRIWVGTFQDVAAYTKAQKEITYEISETGKGFTVIPHLSLDKNLFNESLTAVIEQEKIKKITVRQGGKKLRTQILPGKVIFEFDPFGGKIDIEITKGSDISYDLQTVDAPFPMQPIRISRFPQKDFPITDFGAKTENGFINTKAIAQAMEACNKAGGGRVVIPAGEWWTGPIHFRSNVNLHLEENAVLRFSDNPADYLPAVMTSWEGLECYNYSPLVYAFDCENIAITGKGTLRPQMDTWRKWFSRPQPHLEALKKLYTMASTGIPVEQRQMAEGDNNLRPHLIHFNRCKNVLLDGFKIRESPFWTIHIYMCDGGIARNLDVKAHGHNNDGIDLEMTRNFLVEDCVFDQGDDAVVIKAGRNQDAWRLNMPCENIVVRNCTILKGHALLGIGSEMSGGVRNVYMHDCSAPNNVNRFFYLKTNHRRGGFIENIYMENVHSGTTQSLLEIDTEVLYQWKNLVPTYETRIARIENIVLRNVTCSTTDVVYELKGDARLPIKNVEISNIKVGKVNKYFKTVNNAENVVEKNVTIGSGNKTAYHFDFENKKNRENVLNVNPNTVYGKNSTFGYDLNTMQKDGKPFFFSVDIPEGNYLVKVVLGSDKAESVTTVKAESRRLMLLNVKNGKGQYSVHTFAVNIRNAKINEEETVRIKGREKGTLTWDNKLTLEFNGINPAVSGIEITPANDLPVIFMAGNSTVVDQTNEPWCGWGQAFTSFLSPGVVVANHAESGLKAGSFTAQKRMDKILSQMKAGDYLFIEFGHNDQKETGAGKGPYTSYKTNLKYLVDKTREKGGIPVLITPMHRRRFDKSGKVTNSLGEYPAAVRQLAKEENVALIDLNEMSATLYEAMGVENSIRAFVHYPKGTFPGQEIDLADNTHFNFYGGYQIAQCILRGIIDDNLPLEKYILPQYRDFNPAHPDDVNTFNYPLTPFFEMEKPDGN